MPISAMRSRLRATTPSYTGTVQSVPGGSPCSPDSCESMRRIVSVSIGPNGLMPSRSSDTWSTAGSSRWSRPSSRSCMIAVPVNVLVMEAIRYKVVGSGARRSATSANPIPPNHTSPSPVTTPTAAPGSRRCFTNEAAVASSLSATPSIGSAIVLSPAPSSNRNLPSVTCRGTRPFRQRLPARCCGCSGRRSPGRTGA